MTDLLWRDSPLDETELTALTLDGLLHRLTADCWVAVGTRVDPLVRARALGAPPLTGLAASHATAHWVWWGRGLAPARAEYSTLRRRRIRTSPPGTVVHERNVAVEDVVDHGRLPVTTPARTVHDLLLEIVDTHRGRGRVDDRPLQNRPLQWRERADLPAEAVAAARRMIEPVPRADRRAAWARLAALYRKPDLVAVRTLLAAVLGPEDRILPSAGPGRAVRTPRTVGQEPVMR
ncbi:hypothetical protein [Brevibacterium litoralis]|uniref:hypothetical protein n=1 Tax=Brevibacterium litoralis TaxID=3138935 RepID=UPI0032EFCD5C